ncbi:hypothetical protein [Intestinimonas sp. HCP28S3_D6]|uniref:hypothetical protein n=1 Tax=Intestinimonas sp. HCP28S3_D6 TaxID=3438942 RepID=UPI003F887153
MKFHERLWCSISFLVGAAMAVMALVLDPWRTRLLTVIFAVWCIWLASELLRPRIRAREKRAYAGYRNRGGASRLGQQTEEVLVRHVNYRISAYLHSVFPEAKWEWETQFPARLMLHGGEGLIRIQGVPDYNYAQVQLDPGGKIQCALVRIDPFPLQAEHEEPQQPAQGETLDPQVWFEVQGRKVLEEVIADLSSRGHNSLTMNEDGSVTVESDEGEQMVAAFPSFPQRVYWQQMLRVLERAGYAAGEDGDAITVTW